MDKIIFEIIDQIKENNEALIENCKDFYINEMNYNEKEDGDFLEYVEFSEANDQEMANFYAGYIKGLMQALRIIKEQQLITYAK